MIHMILRLLLVIPIGSAQPQPNSLLGRLLQKFPQHEGIDAAGNLRPFMGMGKGRGSVDGFKIEIVFTVQIQGEWMNPHKRSIAIGPLIGRAAFPEGLMVFTIILNGDAASVAYVEHFTRGGVGVLVIPFSKVGHDLIPVDFSVRKTVQGRDGHTGIVGPTARRKRIGAEAFHVFYRVLVQFFPRGKFYGDAKGVAYGVAQDNGFDFVFHNITPSGDIIAY
jgi:hypothetical protein